MPIMNYYYYYYYSMAGADQRGQKGFQDFWDIKSVYKNSVKLLVREIGQSKHLHFQDTEQNRDTHP